jgi:polyferredoxin
MQNFTHAWVADVVLALHLAFVAFIVVGQVLILSGWAGGWQWTRHWLFRVLHLSAIGFVVLEAWCGVTCPLTVLENWLRRAAGGAGYHTSFIGHWMQRLLYYHAPEWVFGVVYSLFAVIVAVTFVLYPPKRRR